MSATALCYGTRRRECPMLADICLSAFLYKLVGFYNIVKVKDRMHICRAKMDKQNIYIEILSNSAVFKLRMLLFILINVIMPTIVGIVTFYVQEKTSCSAELSINCFQ